MNDLLDDDDAPRARNERERELTLSTGAILSIFFGLVVLCGVCFGFGYKVGRGASPVPLALNDPTSATETPSDPNAANTAAKPAAGSPLPGNSLGIPVPTALASDPTPTPSATPKPAPVIRKPPPTSASDPDSEPVTPRSIEAANTTATPPVAHAVPPSALLPGVSPAPVPGNIMVQVAAVSHQEDADLLVGALRSRGYSVSAHPAGADNFIHVQVGPFRDKKEAEAMRQRLLTDGYNAMLKY